MKLSEKHLVIVFFLLFAISSMFLFWKNTTELDPNQGKNWWTLSFAEPQNSQDLSFVINNHADTARFHYQVLSDREILTEQDVELRKGDQKEIRIDDTVKQDTRMTIRVFLGTERKEIYR